MARIGQCDYPPFSLQRLLLLPFLNADFGVATF